MTERYDNFKEYIGKARGIQQTLNVYLSSDDPGQKSQARNGLEAVLRHGVPHLNVSPITPENVLNDAGVRLKERNERLGIEKFTEDPNSLIDEGKNSSGDNFKDNYLTVTPYEIVGEDEHNKIAKNHRNYVGLISVLGVYSRDPRSMSHNEFVGRTIPYLEEDLKELLGNDPEGLGDLVKSVYATTVSSGEALYTAKIVTKSVKQRIEKLLPEDKRASYVEKTLKARVSAGGDELKIAADDLYRLVA